LKKNKEDMVMMTVVNNTMSKTKTKDIKRSKQEEVVKTIDKEVETEEEVKKEEISMKKRSNHTMIQN
jgi:uncharacterized metal-binding protein